MDPGTRLFSDAAAPLETSDAQVLRSGAALLATGSALLLVLWIVGTLGLVGWGGGALVLLLIGFAILFHGAAWAQLGRGSWARPATRILFLGSVASFVVGLLTLPWTLPPPRYATLAWSLFFPYIPSVFGPVVLFHAALFLVASEALRSPQSFPLVWLGVGILAAVAGVGLAMQYAFLAVNSVPFWFDALGGLTVFGYLPASLGMSREQAPRDGAAV